MQIANEIDFFLESAFIAPLKLFFLFEKRGSLFRVERKIFANIRNEFYFSLNLHISNETQLIDDDNS